jgi:small subunit ribosomal protein S2
MHDQKPKLQESERDMAVVTMRELLDAGVHFGHQTRRWNPKMRRFIFTDRNGIYIIDLQQTLTYIDAAFEFVRETVAHGGTILFVGTKKQAQEAVQTEAERVGMPYVNHRWLGGMLTNFQTVSKRLHRLKELQAMDAAEDGYEGRTKKEILMLTRERTKLERVLGGIAEMSRIPSALWVIDTNKEHIAVNEAHKLNIPVVAILDTNCDPDVVQWPVPGNDDAIRSTALLSRVISTAVEEGKKAREERAMAASREAAGDTEEKAAADAEKAAEAAATEAPASEAPATETPAEAPAAAEATEN